MIWAKDTDLASYSEIRTIKILKLIFRFKIMVAVLILNHVRVSAVSSNLLLELVLVLLYIMNV